MKNILEYINMTVTWSNNQLTTSANYNDDLVNTVSVSAGPKIPFFTKDRGFSFVDAKNYVFGNPNWNSDSSALIKPQCLVDSTQMYGAGCGSWNGYGGSADGYYRLDRNACAMACESKENCKSFSWVSGADNNTRKFVANNIDYGKNEIQITTQSDPTSWNFRVADFLKGDVIIFLEGISGLNLNTPYYILSSNVSTDKLTTKITISDDNKTKKSLTGVSLNSASTGALVAINVNFHGGVRCPGAGDQIHHQCFLWNKDISSARSGVTEHASYNVGTFENWNRPSSATTPDVFYARPNKVADGEDNTYERPMQVSKGTCSKRDGAAMKMVSTSFGGESGNAAWIDGHPDYRACRIPGTIYQQKLVGPNGVQEAPDNQGLDKIFVKCGYTAIDQNFLAQSDNWGSMWDPVIDKRSLMYSQGDANRAKVQFCNNLIENNITDSGVVDRCYTHLNVTNNYDFLYNSVAKIPDWHTKPLVTKAVFNALDKSRGSSDSAKKMIEMIKNLPTPLPKEFVKGVNKILNPNSQALQTDTDTIEGPIDVLVENYCKQNESLEMCGCYNAVKQDLAGCGAHPDLPGCNDVAKLANAFDTLTASDKLIATSTLQKPRVYATACAGTRDATDDPPTIAYKFNPVTGNYQDCKNIIINQGSVGGNVSSTCQNITNTNTGASSDGAGTDSQTASSGGGTIGGGSSSESSIPTWVWILIAVVVLCMSMGGGLAAFVATRK